MRRVWTLFAALLMSLPIAVLAGTTPAGAATCPSQQACVYANHSPSSSITYHWYHYGTHPIYHQNGDHLVVNNQSGGAYLEALGAHKHVLWTLQDGRSLPREAVKDLGPVYYFRLSPGPACWPNCT